MKTVFAGLILLAMMSGCMHSPKNPEKGTAWKIMKNTIVPKDPLETMRIECDRNETAAYKLCEFKKYMKKEKNVDLPIYLSPEAANKMCKAQAIIAMRVDDLPLGQCIWGFCREFGLRCFVKDDLILIDLNKTGSKENSDDLVKNISAAY